MDLTPLDLSTIRRVVIAHNPVGADDDPSTSDVLAQVELVAAGLDALGIPHQTVPVPDWRPWLPLNSAAPGTVVFNLMEAPPGRPGALLGAAAALELMGLPFTGSAPGILWITTDKLATRAVLADEGLPVAPGGRFDPDCPRLLDRIPGPWILKPACEDASLGLEGDPVCATPEAAVARARDLAKRFPGQAVVAETFLPGRELNVSLLAKDGDVEVLPVAEMVYEDFPEGMSRVLTYEAKWHDDSFVSIHTVRRFLDDPADAELIARAGELAAAAWKVFGLKGYARIDLRLDAAGEPRILEVNANPCLAAGAGYMAAAKKAGLSARDVVERILKDAVVPATVGLEPSSQDPHHPGPLLPSPPNPPHREKREKSKRGHKGQQGQQGRRAERPSRDPSPGVGDGVVGRGAGVRVLGGGSSEEKLAPVPRESRPGDRSGVTIRRGLDSADRAPIEELIRATSFFNAEEVDVAMELVDDRLTQGEASHYRFLVGEVDGDVGGYACWGPIPGSQESADLYWIVVHPRFQGRGVGAALLRAAEDWMSAAGRPRVYVETSTRPQYLPTRAFYTACGYHLASELPDFYAPGDGKATFLKVLTEKR